MGVLSVVLLVLFVINAILLVLLVLIQNDEGGGLGGIFSGGSDTAFGSRSGNVLTRATTILGSLFLIISFSLAVLSRTPSMSGVEEEARRLSSQDTGYNWLDEEINPSPAYSFDDFTFEQLMDDDFFNENFLNPND